MNAKMIVGALALSVALCTQGYSIHLGAGRCCTSACAPACEATCAPNCCDPCCNPCGRCDLFAGLKGLFACNTGCNTGCGTSCGPVCAPEPCAAVCDPAPACCDPAPACCDPAPAACAPVCKPLVVRTARCRPCRPILNGVLDALFGCGCGVCNSCNKAVGCCDPVGCQPECCTAACTGCGVAAPAPAAAPAPPPAPKA